MPRRLVTKTVIYKYARDDDPDSSDDSDYEPKKECYDDSSSDDDVSMEDETENADTLCSESQASCYFTDTQSECQEEQQGGRAYDRGWYY